mgnify:FL=1
MKNKGYLLLVAVLSTGCVTPQTQYHWGEYESLLYQMYANPSEATPELQIQQLTQDKQEAEAAGKPIAPGINAHMGMMHAAMGNLEAAIAAFEEEKLRYPESKQFMDDMIDRAKGGKE